MILCGDALEQLRTLDASSVHTCVTSPPYYGLRDYGHAGQIGLEDTPTAYVDRLVAVFAEVARVLRDDGTLWLNLGDSYAGSRPIGRNDTSANDLARRSARYRTGKGKGSAVGHQGTRPSPPGLKTKDLMGIPWRVAFALQDAGWYLRSEIIWHKPNPMPESVKDRPTKAHETLFLLTRSPRYYYDHEAIKEPCTEEYAVSGRHRRPDTALRTSGFEIRGSLHSQSGSTQRNKRSVWTIASQPYPGAHFAVMPPALVEPCIKAGAPIGGVVLDPFCGAGTVGMVARRQQREFVGVEINPTYAEMARCRIESDAPLFNRRAL